MQKFQEFLRSLLRHYRQANVSDSAAVLTYYSLLSIFPILLIAGNLISLLRLDTDWVLSYIKPVLPVPVFETVSPIIRSFLEQGSGTTLSIGILVTIWSASQMVAAFQRSINQAYGIDSTNALVSRFLSFLMILVLVILIFIISFVYGLSETVIDTVAPWLHISPQLTQFVGSMRLPVSATGLFLLACLLYYVVPMVRVKWRFVWMGALVTTVGWLLLSQGFALYIRYFAQRITSYKTIGTFIVTIIWLNLSAYILMLGGVVNAASQEWHLGPSEETAIVKQLRKTRRSMKKKPTKKRSASKSKHH
ncbi:YihY family inner membrane protein [Secundilactobacillus kimchicus]|uniref:YihY/virulence factor BrkB family protein n=1 Tax=Secundilactobacillus kimchicus TaxID=528209 RepID=UPI0007050341|nr:YihY/virulence factor BrkB family protein [Secundilactobacillus kimchicus]MBT9671726.1 YihY family inner membrane protein [Secundilactobacillus kimchicus]